MGSEAVSKKTLRPIFCIIFCSTFFRVYLKVKLKDIWDMEEVPVVCANQKGLLLGARCISAPSGRVPHEQRATT